MPTQSKDLLPPQRAPTPRTTCPPSPEIESSQIDDDNLSHALQPTEGNTALDMAISQEAELYNAEQEQSFNNDNHEDNRRTRLTRNESDERSRGDDGKSEKSAVAFEATNSRDDRRSPIHSERVAAPVDCALTPHSMCSIDRISSPITSPSPAIDDAADPSPSPSTTSSAIQAAPASAPAPNLSNSDHTTSPSATTTPSPWDFTSIRLTPQSLHHSSFLRPGSRFTGTQSSDQHIYNVDVSLQHVSIPQSFLCGYLRIQGLTEDNPSLTTYFEGELIGTTHTFITKHPDWGATEKIDQSHWERFTAFKPLKHEAKKNNFTLKGWWNRENIFMRWKEHFLVPDHRVRTIAGASFEGFYYICYNQVEGRISGIYFHAKSEKYQQLELNHVDDRGCWGAQEFR